MQIRLATAFDAKEMLSIYTPYVTSSNASWEYAPPSLKEFTQRIEEHIRDGFPWLCAEENGTILGYAYAGRYAVRKGYDFSCETTVYVAQNAHKKGVGNALYSRLLALLKLQGYCNAFALITQPNDVSEQFHLKQGFAKDVVLQNMGYKNGQWLGLGIYSLQLCENMPKTPTQTVKLNKLSSEQLANILK